MLKINPSNTGGVAYGLHPNLSPEVANVGQPKGLLDVWNQGKLAILCNVGTLIQPITRAQYLANIGHPYQLFSHSDQQTEFQTSTANTVGQTGWGGRIADVTCALNGATPLPMNISVAGTALFATGSSSRQLAISPYTTLNSALQLNMEGGSTADQNARRTAFQQLLGFDLDSIPINAASDTTNQALVASAALNTNPTLATLFPTTGLGYQLQQVARLIKVRDSIGMKRQIFFCALGGFDTHTNQTGTVPTSTSSAGSGGSGGQGSLLAQLSQAMRAFYDEMGAQGMSDQVTTFTFSDFGRTLAAFRIRRRFGRQRSRLGQSFADYGRRRPGPWILWHLSHSAIGRPKRCRQPRQMDTYDVGGTIWCDAGGLVWSGDCRHTDGISISPPVLAGKSWVPQLRSERYESKRSWEFVRVESG